MPEKKFKKSTKKLNVKINTETGKAENAAEERELTPEERNENFKLFTLFALRSICQDMDSLRYKLEQSIEIVEGILDALCEECDCDDCTDCIFNIKEKK
jgi:hypothetical protein